MTDLILLTLLFFLPNVFMGADFMHEALSSAEANAEEEENYFTLFLQSLDINSFRIWATVNLVLLSTFLILRRHVITPMYTIIKHIRIMLNAHQTHTTSSVPMIVSMRLIAVDIARMTQLAQTYYRQHQEASHALSEVRMAMGQILSQHNTIISHTSREMLNQYHSVLTYAHYLEEQIARRAVDPALRYDFDEVSESSFNLKLIAGALNLMQTHELGATEPVNVPELIEKTMLALAPSLDRRSMKLTTIEVDLAVMALSNPTVVIHVLWMLLLGTIRYAADESTLRLRCLYNRERTQALLSIVVSELSPGRLTEEERSTFMAHQLQHLTPHLFAETIRIQANIQLAELLLKPLDAAITILPLTTYSCEICLLLPALDAK